MKNIIARALTMSIFFFFFQAEDGIRDHCVTGVQTCALPISRWYSPIWHQWHQEKQKIRWQMGEYHRVQESDPTSDSGSRSEERRVGKECRSRWSTYH